MAQTSKTQQQIATDYLQNHQIIQSLEKALNMAIEHQISAPENFIADYLLKQKLCQDPYIYLVKIVQLQRKSLYIVDFIGTLRHFEFASEKSSDFPVLEAGAPQQVDLLQPPADLLSAFGGNVQCLINCQRVLQVLLRETKIEQIFRLLGRPKQEVQVPRLITPLLQLGGVELGVVMRRDATGFVRLLCPQKAQVPLSLAFNEKSCAFTPQNDFMAQSGELDTAILSFAQFKEEIKLKAKTLIDENADGAKPAGAKPTGAKQPKQPTKYSQPEQIIAAFRQFSARHAERNVCKIFIRFTQQFFQAIQCDGEFENFLLSAFMAANNDVILIFQNINNKMGDAAAKPAEQGAKQPKQAKSTAQPQQPPYQITVQNINNELIQALRQYDELSGSLENKCKITVFSDCSEIEQAIQFQTTRGSKLVQCNDEKEFYQQLTALDMPENGEKMSFFIVSDEKPQSKGAERGKKVVQQSKYCSKGLAAIICEADYLELTSEQDMYEFLAEIEGIMTEERGFYG